MITIIFVIIYSIWYNSYTTHLFLLASEDKEKKFTKVKSDLREKRENLIDENRQKHLFLQSTVKNSNQYQPPNNLKNISTWAAC